MTIDYQALRDAAEAIKIAATPQKLLAFRMKVTPQVVLALLDERERNQQYIKRRDQENEDIALTVGKLRVELEGKDSKIANLTAERDALREGEMGDARHSNTRAAADIYFQLVEECEIPAGGSLVEYVDDMREKLEAAEKRIAELEAEPVSQTYKSQHTQFEQVADLYEMQFDDGRTCAFHTDAQKAAQWLQACDGNRVQEYVKLERLQNALSGNSPVTPDGWISCSERMPVIGEINWRTSFPLLVACEIGVIPAYYGFVRVNGNKHYGFMESLKYGDDSGNHPQTNEYDLISNVTHWMPLPEPPQEVNRG
ncbi:ead/Ea22-like family protein [Escherichia coli]|nr:ead/Ea22-like family protein [Escherichia coli]